MAATNPRLTQYQLKGYIRKVVNYNDTGIASGVKIGTLPSGSLVFRTDVAIDTAFNAGTSNSITVGTNSGTDNKIVSAQQATESSTGMYRNLAPNGAVLTALTSDTDIYAAYVQTGTAATAGKAYIVIEYVPNNDG